MQKIDWDNVVTQIKSIFGSEVLIEVALDAFYNATGRSINHKLLKAELQNYGITIKTCGRKPYLSPNQKTFSHYGRYFSGTLISEE